MLRFLATGLVATIAALSPISAAAADGSGEASPTIERDRASLVNELASFVAESDHVDDRASVAAMDAGRYSSALERLVSATTSTDTDVSEAAVCVGQPIFDPLDMPSLDGAAYGLSYDCDSGLWTTAVVTYDDWFDSQLDYLDLIIDIDLNANNGCMGGDYHVIGLYSDDFELVAGVVRTPSCDETSWIDKGFAYIDRIEMSDIGIVFDKSQIDLRTSFRWAAYLKDVSNTQEDAMPDLGLHSVLVPTPPPPPPGPTSGYWMLGSGGAVYGFGAAKVHAPVSFPSVAISAANNGGYWILTADGQVHSRNAPHFGHANPNMLAPGERFSSIAGRPQGDGYWVFTDRGRAFAFGAARHVGDMSAIPLNGAVIASTATATGNGYWMVGSDGGIFSFGDAQFYGSMGGQHLNEPVVGIAPDPDGSGYWLVSSDGGIFAFQANFAGSVPGVLLPGQRLNKPVIGALSYGSGYLMVASDGGIFSFSDQPFHGSLGANPPANPIIGVAVWKS